MLISRENVSTFDRGGGSLEYVPVLHKIFEQMIWNLTVDYSITQKLSVSNNVGT